MSAPSAPPRAGPTLAERRAAIRGRGGPAADARGRGAARAAPARPPAALTNIFQNVTPEGRDILTFRMTPTHVSYANTLRRTMITEVETIAFRADILPTGATADVQILKNSTPMSNEMLAHRIGLLPIAVENPLAWNPDEYTFKLDVTNPTGELRDVVAADIQVFKKRGPLEEDLPVPSVEFFHPDPVTRDTALLAVLKGKVGTQEPEALSFVAKATIGTGRENARFMPVTSRCAYGYTLDEDPDHRREVFTRWLTGSKKMSQADLDANPAKKEELEREFATMEVQRCYKVDERGEPYSFDFLVESVGVLRPVYIVGRALDILQAKCLKYASIDSGSLPPTLRVVPAEARGMMFDFVFQGEDHTLGNLLQTWMEQNLMDRGDITFVGYKVPHPLRDEMVVRVGVKGGKDSEARAAVAKACRECAQMFRTWSEMWSGASGYTPPTPPVAAAAPAEPVGPEPLVPAAGAGAGAAAAPPQENR